MKFDEKRFDIFISKGDSEGLTVKEGTVFLTGLDEVDQYADIELEIDGTFSRATRRHPRSWCVSPTT